MIKPCIKYIKVGDSIELATHKNNFMASEIKSIIELLQRFFFYK